MGREIRRVPADWEHPKNEDGRYQPLYDECYEDACHEWYEACIEAKGKATWSHSGEKCWYHEYHGNPPDEKYYRNRKWTEGEATHIQMYETVSEGTPVSPVFATKDEMVNYLCEHGDFWDQKRRADPRNTGMFRMPCDPWTRKNAESFVNSGFAMSGIIADGKLYGPSEQGEIKDRTSCAPEPPQDTAEQASTDMQQPQA